MEDKKAICGKCGGDRFYSIKNKSGKYYSYCSDCRRETWRKKYPSRKELFTSRSRARIGMLRSRLIEYLSDKKCTDCPENDIVVLDFDHTRDKYDTISSMVRRGCSWERILKEIEKCIIRCANCHRKRTAKQFNWKKLSVV